MEVSVIAVAVSVAFADSSIVVLALPELYGRFDTTIAAVAWVITSYNVAVAVGGLALVALVGRLRGDVALAVGSLVFLASSIGCAVAGSLPVLVAARSVQGIGGALLLCGALIVLERDACSAPRGLAIWTAAGTFGAALGPALGGVLTQVFDWRAIFVMQAPVSAAALVAAIGSRRHVPWVPARADTADRAVSGGPEERPGSLAGAIPPNVCLALAFGALVGALFLGVLLVVDVFGLAPIEGAAVVSAIPIGAVMVRLLGERLPTQAHAVAGGLLLGMGLVALALLPSATLWFAIGAFWLCGVGLGLAVPGLTHVALGRAGSTDRAGALTVGVRHLGLVLALAAVAPMLAADLTQAVDVAMLNGTAVVIDGRIPATIKVPLALDIRDVIDRAPKGEVPDLAAVFAAHGALNDPAVRLVRDDLTATIEAAITRGFRRSFVMCAALAVLAAVVASVFRRSVAA